MSEKKANPYSCAIFLEDQGTNGQGKFNVNYVHSMGKLTAWLEEKGVRWHHINVYSRKDQNFITQIKANDPETFVDKP